MNKKKLLFQEGAVGWGNIGKKLQGGKRREKIVQFHFNLFFKTDFKKDPLIIEEITWYIKNPDKSLKTILA